MRQCRDEADKTELPRARSREPHCQEAANGQGCAALRSKRMRHNTARWTCESCRWCFIFVAASIARMSSPRRESV